MALSQQLIDHAPATVFRALITPETYPFWLVGCRDIRAVDEGWPSPGTAFHHRVGLFGPVTVADNTVVVEVVEPERLVLEARARPFGRARVTFRLEPEGQAGTHLVVEEVLMGRLTPLRPVLDLPTRLRNDRSLANLADYLGAGRLLTENLVR